MKKLLLNLLWCQLRSLGIPTSGEHSLVSLRSDAGVSPVFDSWLAESVRMLESEGYLKRRGEKIVVGAAPDPLPDALWRQWEQEQASWLANPDLRAQMVLLDVALRALPDVLTGRKRATEIIFPDSSVTLVENIYKHNPMADYFNQALASRVEAYVRQRAAQVTHPDLRILEIGAGTGATSAVVLDKLGKLQSAIREYCYTDLSKAFLHHAQRTYGPASPFLSYRILDIEAPVADQDIDLGAFDVVIAANVLHATRNIKLTLRNTKRLLKRNGLLFLNELAINSLFNHLTFGLLEGWWRYEDPELRIQGSPGLAPQTWQHVLENEGFRGVNFPCLDALDLGQQIILAESDGILRLPAAGDAGTPAPVTSPRPASAPAEPTGRVASQPQVDRVREMLTAQLAEALCIDKERLLSDEPFSSYGLDSILAVNLTRSINESFGTDLEITVMFEHNTIDALRALIVSQLGEPAVVQRLPADPLPEASPALENVVAGRIVAILADALCIEAACIDRSEPFASYGLDSIIAVNVTRLFKQEWKIDLDLTVMFEHGTVDLLSTFIVANHRPELVALLAASSPAVAQPLPPPPVVRAKPIAATAPAVTPMHAAADGVAIIGVNGKFAGADDIHAFWRVIEEGRTCISKPPIQRADWQSFEQAASAVNGPSLWGGFIDGVHEFDPLFFGIAPAEAEQMSPEQRLMLQCVWNTIEDAGYTPRQLATNPTGVFIATGPSEYRRGGARGEGERELLDMPSLSILPNRISYLLNLHGPSEFCDTTCSSSLVALHRAVQSIRLGECEQAIVGGVNLILSPRGYAGMAAAGMLSGTGRVQPFQDGAQGTVRSEGVGAILLKPLQQAIADNDHIYAVVKGTGVAHGGKGVSITAPNIRGMKMAMEQAYRQAGIAPRSVGYIEAHGMASALADGAEISALKSGMAALAAELSNAASVTPGTQYLSTLKPNIGHAEVASGMAALIKVVQSLRHRTIPGIAGFNRLSEAISLDGGPLKIADKNIRWEPLDDGAGGVLPRRASINSYGIGGVNAHAVLEEHVSPQMPASAPGAHIFVLSARDDERLRAKARAFLGFIQADESLPLREVVATLQTGREEMEQRFAAVVHSPADLIEVLGRYLAADSEQIQGPGWIACGVAERNGELAQLFSGTVGDTLLEALLGERKYEDIARYWVKGVPINWRLLYRDQPSRKVSLPGYPFKSLVCGSVRAAADATAGQTSPAESGGAVQPRLENAILLNTVIGSALGLSPSQIDPARPLGEYGLNSLLLIKILSEIRQTFPAFPLEWLTPQYSVADVLDRLSDIGALRASRDNVVHLRTTFPELVRLNSVSQGRPVFWIHGALGSVETFQSIAARSGRPFYAIQARGFGDNSAPNEGIAAMTAYYLAAICSVQPTGPYDLGGFCLGGILAYEMTRQLQLEHETVHTLSMIDSPDNTGLSRSGAVGMVPFKNAALQVVNTLLWPTAENAVSKIVDGLIDQDEVDNSIDDEQFVQRLAVLAADRGLAMSTNEIVAFIKRNINVQVAYKLHEFKIQPLPDPRGVDCYYFRNRSGLFYGALGRYFKTANDPFSLDHVNYWQDWEREIGNFNIVDIESSSHMTILTEQKSKEAIIGVCEKLYTTNSVKSYG